MSSNDHGAVSQSEFDVEDSKKPIQCIKFARNAEELDQPATLVFTHGAGGTIRTDAVIDFITGFVKTSSPAVCFQGNMNLNSRVRMFQTVRQEQGAVRVLGGRSMGARAAVMAADADTTHLILVSYPLQAAGKATRDQILLDIPSHIKVIFISGDRDSMCSIDALEDVRSRMVCKSWLCVVNGADHGMKVTPKSKNRAIVMKTGEILASWLQDPDCLDLRTHLTWNSDSEMPKTAASVRPSKRKRAKPERPKPESSMTRPSRRKRRK